MFMKSLIAAALVVPAIALSSAAFAGQAYQGGPKSGLTTNTHSFEPNKPYAQDVGKPYAQDLNARTGKHMHIYQGGPQTSVPHGR